MIGGISAKERERILMCLCVDANKEKSPGEIAVTIETR